jgi:hypothetical protein
VFTDLARAFADLFTQRRSRITVGVLLVAMAVVPVAELGVIRTFSKLIIQGPQQFQTDRGAVLASAFVFFVGFGITRGLHHLVRFWRVRVFRTGLESSGLQRTHGQASWEWAQGFELSAVSVGLIQVATFGALFIWVDPVVGGINAVICAAAVAAISTLYKRQLASQLGFAAEGTRPGSTAISRRIATRVFAAEFGSVVATTSMALMMLVVLWRTLTRHLDGADGVVLFLGLRLLYGHLGALSPSVMRFARDSVRRAGVHAQATVSAIDVTENGIREASDQQQPKGTGRQRTRMLTHLVMSGQRGELDRLRDLTARLGTLTDDERQTVRVADAFAAYATRGDAAPPLWLTWWPRPFPGNFGDWLSPFTLQRRTGRRVAFHPPTAAIDAPSLVMVGSIGRFVRPRSVVVGTGVPRPDTALDPAAQFISVRGPITAAAVRRSGGPTVDTFGDPALLLSRLLPLPTGADNGRLALVRHHEHADLPVTLAETIDEYSVLASSPDDIAALITNLADYAGVITSAMHVMIACHSYGVPCTLVTFRGFERGITAENVKYRDYSLGAGLAEVWEPEPVDLDMTGLDWAARLRTEKVADQKLDEVEAALAVGVREYEAAVEQYAEESDDDCEDDVV